MIIEMKYRKPDGYPGGEDCCGWTIPAAGNGS